jgi:hypothetical protein
MSSFSKKGGAPWPLPFSAASFAFIARVLALSDGAMCCRKGHRISSAAVIRLGLASMRSIQSATKASNPREAECAVGGAVPTS